VRQSTDAIRFTFTGAGGTLTNIGLFDAAYGGNSLTWAALDHAAMETGRHGYHQPRRLGGDAELHGTATQASSAPPSSHCRLPQRLVAGSAEAHFQ
jgi:hypothetical protein